jgi:hypothetical protein
VRRSSGPGFVVRTSEQREHLFRSTWPSTKDGGTCA